MSGRVLVPLGHSSLIIVCYQAEKLKASLQPHPLKKKKNTEERKHSWASRVIVINSILDSLGLKRPSLLLFMTST